MTTALELLVPLPGGPFLVGTDAPWIPADEEGPARPVRIEPFALAAHAVTVADFARFVAETDHVTDAERAGWSFVFAGEVAEGSPVRGRSSAAPWWLGVGGASWRSPDGQRDALETAPEHPAVHVSWDDAVAYCAWAGGRLPTEAEWEHAAAAGVAGRAFPWGDELLEDGEHRCNTWQGTFPGEDTGEDGHRGRAPVDAFEPNGFGLWNTVGNVWEWTADAWDRAGPAEPGCCAQGDSPKRARVQKGGSYLCHASYCARYRIQARLGNPPDTTTGNAGFRLARDVGA